MFYVYDMNYISNSEKTHILGINFSSENIVFNKHKNGSTIQEYTDYHTICFCF